jgi:lauroyl/myristoyl acyltransferase
MTRPVLVGRPTLQRLAWRAVVAVARTLPIDAVRLLGVVLGNVGWLCDRRGRRVVADNLRRLLPPGTPEALARATRRSYVAFACSVGESLIIDRLPGSLLSPRHLTLHDPWQVMRERPLRGPVILVTVHANWELLLGVLHATGLTAQIETVALTEADPWMDGERVRLRGAAGCRSVTMDRAPLAALRAVQQGRVLGLVADRDYAGTGLVVPVAGGRLRLPIGPAALAVQTGAPIVPLLLARSSWRDFRLIVGRPLVADAGMASRHAVQQMTVRLGRTIARMLMAAPAQWVAFHPAFEPDQAPGAPEEVLRRASDSFRPIAIPGDK